MDKKDKKDKDEFTKRFGEEFRTVRFYSNIDGVGKEYGYDYKRDKDGKEEYREIGEIPEQFGKEFIDRIHKLDRSFDWDDSLFSRSFERFADIFPSFDRLFGGFGRPSLLPGDEKQRIEPEVKSKQDYEVAYDLQVDKKNNQLYLIIELPGFAKEDVNLKLLKNQLHLIADNGKKQIDTKIPLQYDIDKNSKIDATMKHGILEVKLSLAKSENGDEKDIPIN
jgi:HSP20 family molecular chaperone IbpA